MIIINYQSRSYMLEPLPHELRFETYNRLWKIIGHNPDLNYHYDRLVNVSKLWYYKKRYNCRYSEQNERQINQFDQSH
jgi:hypothetical protein